MKEKSWEIELIKEVDWLFRLDNGKLCNDDGLIVSEAMRKAIHLTYYRINLQDKFNKENWITPKTVYSEIKDMWLKSNKTKRDYSMLDRVWVEKELSKLELEMDIAAANMEYEKAAELRDAILDLKKGKKKK